MSNMEEVRPIRKSDADGGSTETVIGASTEGLGEYLVSSGSLPDDDAFRRVRDEAVAIVRRCRPFRGPDGTRTGLVVGYVQSGKTMSMTTVSSLARDNGCRIIIMLAGVTTNLLRQNASRFRDTLRKAAGGEEHWLIINSEEAKNRDQEIQTLRQAVEEWRDKGMAEVDKRTLFFAVLKHHKHLEWLERVLSSESLKGISSLILDDEADQASLNVKPDADDPSTTYARIQKVRDALPNHTYLQYTATPQAPLLINIDDILSPAFAELVEPGTGYTGGQHFFGPSAPPGIVKIVPLEDRFKPGEPPEEPPSSLLEALAVFVVGSAVARVRKKPKLRAMLVHPSPRTSDHGVFHEWINGIIKRWGTTLSDAQSDDRQDTLDELRRGYEELEHTDKELPPFDDSLLEHVRLTLRRVQPKKINSEDASEVDWANTSDHILVGGEKLNRGYTVEGLTVTYMPRDAGGWNADTLQQRARFFGYKASYLSLCRLYLHPDVAKAFRDYVSHEQDVRGQLAEHRGKPLREWRRTFFLSSKLAPTRKNILTDPLFRFKATDDWFLQRYPHLDSTAAEDNERLVDGFLKTLTFDHDIHGQRAAEIPLARLFSDLLIDFRAPSEKAGWYAQLVLIRKRLDALPDAMALVVEMRRNDGGLVRDRTENGNAVALHQGASSKKEGGYPGDAKVLEPTLVVAQIHTVKVGERRPVKALAVFVPDKPSDIISQG